MDKRLSYGDVGKIVADKEGKRGKIKSYDNTGFGKVWVVWFPESGELPQGNDWKALKAFEVATADLTFSK